MAIAFVHSVGNIVTTGTPSSLNSGSIGNTTGGNFVWVAVMWNDPTDPPTNSVNGVTDSAGNTYTAIGPPQQCPTALGGTFMTVQLFYKTNITGGTGVSFTVTMHNSITTSVFLAIAAHEYSGVATTSDVVDQQGRADSTLTGNNTTIDHAFTSPMFDNELIVGACVTGGGVSTPGTGYNLRQSANIGSNGTLDRIVSSRSDYNVNISNSNDVWVLTTATFKAATEAAGNGIKRVQLNYGAPGAASSVALKLPFPTTTGNSIVVVVKHSSHNTFAVVPTDSQSNTYVQVKNANDGANRGVTMWVAQNITGGSSNTVTFSGGADNYVMYVAEYSGVVTSGNDGTNSNNEGPTTTYTSNGITTTKANSVIVAGHRVDSSAVAVTPTSPFEFCAYNQDASDGSTGFFLDIFPSSTGTYQSQGTYDISSHTQSVIAAFPAPVTGDTVTISGRWDVNIH